jgi:hypothetical protein
LIPDRPFRASARSGRRLALFQGPDDPFFAETAYFLIFFATTAAVWRRSHSCRQVGDLRKTASSQPVQQIHVAVRRNWS